MPADMRASLTELATLIKQRAETLTEDAIKDGQPWARALGPEPSDPAHRAAWHQHLRAIAAYRDRYGITGTDPLGPAPPGQGQRLDRERATLAARRAQAAAEQSVARQRTQAQQIDTGRGLAR